MSSHCSFHSSDDSDFFYSDTMYHFHITLLILHNSDIPFPSTSVRIVCH